MKTAAEIFKHVLNDGGKKYWIILGIGTGLLHGSYMMAYHTELVALLWSIPYKYLAVPLMIPCSVVPMLYGYICTKLYNYVIYSEKSLKCVIFTIMAPKLIIISGSFLG